jgi:hypothetical protein
MIGTWEAFLPDNLARKGTEAALHAVSDDRAADLPGDGKPDPHRRVRIVAIADKEDKAWRRGAEPTVGGEEVRALLDRA